MSLLIPKEYVSKIFGKFLTKFIKGNPEDCWEWFGTIDKRKDTHCEYGCLQFRINTLRIKFSAHVVSYAYFNNLRYLDFHVLHTCDNTICVNPNHLFKGNNTTNRADCVFKGRTAMGITQGLHKLTEEEVLEIRRLYKTGNYTLIQLANEYNVHYSNIGYIVNNKTWKHLLA